MRTKAPATRPRARARSLSQAGDPVRNRRVVTAALITIVAVLVLLPLVVQPYGHMNWTYQVVMLCLVVAAAAGYALLGRQAPAEEQEEPRLWSNRVLVPLVFLAAVLPYLPTLAVGFLSDDYGITARISSTESPLAFFALHQISRLYRGLHFSAWWLQYQLWGDAAPGYHAVNLLFHGLNAALVYVLGKRLMGRRLPALFAGLLFAVHPLHTESVTWACGQVDLQATLFSLLSLLCLDAFLRAPRRRTRVLALSGAWVLFALALLTKESAAALPGAAVLWSLLRTKRGERRPVWLVAEAYGLVLVGYAVLRLASLGGVGGYYITPGFWNTVFPTAPLRQMYVFFFPVNFTLFGLLPLPVSWWLLPLALAVLGAAVLACLRALPALPAGRVACYLGFSVVMATPVWVLAVPTQALQASRFAYLPTIGLAWLVGELMAVSRASRPARAPAPWLALAGAAVLCVWYLAPWFQAKTVAAQAVAAAVRVVQATPRADREPVFFMTSLPAGGNGAQVFRNCFPVAVQQALGRPVLMQTVGPDGDLPDEALNAAALQPGEYVYAWDPQRRDMELVKRGGRPVTGGVR